MLAPGANAGGGGCGARGGGGGNPGSGGGEGAGGGGDGTGGGGGEGEGGEGDGGGGEGLGGGHALHEAGQEARMPSSSQPRSPLFSTWSVQVHFLFAPLVVSPLHPEL